MPPLDLDAIRALTPGCQDKLFLNSAGASLMPSFAYTAIQDYLSLEAQWGGYMVEGMEQAAIQVFYEEAAKMLNTQPRNIAWASSATDAYSKALSAIDFKAGDVILTSDDDYVSNYLQFINLKARYGVQIHRMAMDGAVLDLEKVAEQMDRLKPRLVALTHVPTNSGLVQDVAAVGRLCKDRGLRYLVDACQSVGQMQVDVQELHCDFLSVTGRKFMRCPRGTGFLYVSDKVLAEGLHPITMDGMGATWTKAESYTMADSAKRFELFEKPYALLVAFGQVLRYTNGLGMANIESYNRQLMHQLREGLGSIKGLTLYDGGPTPCNILTFRKNGLDQKETKAKLDAASLLCGIAHRQHAVIDLDKKGVEWVVRLSPHYFNTLEEMGSVVEVVEGM
jgi:cysteine desulfurase / selenocysteine lyase